MASTRIARIQRILDRGFQKCFEDAEAMISAFSSQDPGDIDFDSQIRETTKKLYEHMLEAMFRVLPLVQPDDCPKGKEVNLYFWPGFKSYFTNRRSFYPYGAPGKRPEDVGIGRSADPNLDPQDWNDHYSICSHARWYGYATTRPKEMNYFPGSLYRWFNDQIPRVTDNRHDLIQSLAVTVDPQFTQDEDIAFQVLQLDPTEMAFRSVEWGPQLANRVNTMAPYVADPNYKFPDRKDRSGMQDVDNDERYRPVRCMLLALWMHACFASEAPAWLLDLERELAAANLTGVLEQLKASRSDPYAMDWGDRTIGRPQFTTWTTISLHWMLTPPPADLLGVRQSGADKKGVVRQMIGSATFTSSVPLRKDFIALVRPWIRSIYGMMRNAEISTHLRQQRAEQLMRAGTWLSHELTKLLKTCYPNVRKQMKSADPACIADRQAAWDLITQFADITNLWAKANTLRDPASRDALRERFLQPLHELRNAGRLQPSLRSVAAAFYESSQHEALSIPELEEPGEAPELTNGQRSVCFLLVSEMIGNFCRHERNQSAAWSVEVGEDRLMITLVAGTSLRERPSSWTFAYIDEFLNNTELGSAKVRLVDKKLTWLVSVNLGTKEAVK